ncbi:MAG: GNAT family N-acetyltransferase [Pseudomonadales bacterium]
MNIQIRDERAADAETIAELTREAFADVPYSDHREHLIVDALRARGQLAFSLVAIEQGEIVGHIAASAVTINGSSANWLGVAPLSVAPSFQGQGIGSQLMRALLQRLRESGAAGCVLLGEPSYYSRFGFEAKSGLVLEGVPPEYFQVLTFIGDTPSGTVAYSDAFAVGT